MAGAFALAAHCCPSYPCKQATTPIPEYPLTGEHLDYLTAAILCDQIYCSSDETFISPPNCKLLEDFYDPLSGYYGQAWKRASHNGGLDQLFLVSRGTCLSPPKGRLRNSYVKDFLLTVFADAEMLTGHKSCYFDVAETFFKRMINCYPYHKITVTGHSLAGGTINFVLQNEKVKGVYFNPLISRRPFDISPLNSEHNIREPRIIIFQNNEDIFCDYLGGGFLSPFERRGLIKEIRVPHLPEISSNNQATFSAHLPEAIIGAVARYGVRPNAYQDALDLIEKCYPPTRPAFIQAFLDNSRNMFSAQNGLSHSRPTHSLHPIFQVTSQAPIL